jgi:hypothetical protein
MINRITMETVACLRSECHLKQNLIPIWQGSLWAADSWHWRDIIGNAALKEWKRVRLPQSFCVMSGSCGKKSELTFRCLEWKIILRPTDPRFFWHVTVNTHIFLFGLIVNWFLLEYYYYTKYERDMVVGQEPAMGFSQNNFSLETSESEFRFLAISFSKFPVSRHLLKLFYMCMTS